jgi:O-acetyl-ADP-ribose deacetylase
MYSKQTFCLVIKDITELEADVIVNAANEYLRPGGGVCGAIFEAAGNELEYECLAIGHCEQGDAVLTDAYNLKNAQGIIHAVGPKYGESYYESTLYSCYQRSLEIARENDYRTIIFPAISCGIYGVPIEEGAKIAIEAIIDYIESYPKAFEVITISVLNQNAYNCYKNIFEEYYPNSLQETMEEDYNSSYPQLLING